MKVDYSEILLAAKEIVLQIPTAVKKFFLTLSDQGISAFWIAGILAACCLFWGFTWNARAATLRSQVNRVLMEQGETRLLQEPVGTFRMRGAASALGNWYTLGDGRGVAVVFSYISDGILQPALAYCGDDGRIGRIIPLSPQFTSSLVRPDYTDLYTGRIEGVAPSVLQYINERKE